MVEPMAVNGVALHLQPLRTFDGNCGDFRERGQAEPLTVMILDLDLEELTQTFGRFHYIVGDVVQEGGVHVEGLASIPVSHDDGCDPRVVATFDEAVEKAIILPISYSAVDQDSVVYSILSEEVFLPLPDFSRFDHKDPLHQGLAAAKLTV